MDMKKYLTWKNSLLIILPLIFFNIGHIVFDRPLVFIESIKKVSNCACIPCVEEPRLEKCEFNSFAYKAIVNKKDIMGNDVLRAGDIYYFTNHIFYKNFDDFCHKDKNGDIEDCVPVKLILDKTLFREVK